MPRTVTFTILIDVEVPDGATHYHGDPTKTMDGSDEPTLSFYKHKDVGVVGDHWFLWRPARGDWSFVSHTRPLYVKELPL